MTRPTPPIDDTAITERACARKRSNCSAWVKTGMGLILTALLAVATPTWLLTQKTASGFDSHVQENIRTDDRTEKRLIRIEDKLDRILETKDRRTAP